MTFGTAERLPGGGWSGWRRNLRGAFPQSHGLYL